MADREQIRRDAESAQGYGGQTAGIFANHCLALLIELEQAEQSIKTILKEDGVVVSRQAERLKQADRLAEAAREVADACARMGDRGTEIGAPKLREALAAWEQTGMIELSDGRSVPFAQAVTLGRHIKEMGRGNCHWHFNDCGCCVTLHGSDCAYVIGSDGEETFYAERGCECEHG